MKRAEILCIFVVLLASHGMTKGQTRNATYSVPFTLGWEGAVGSSNQKKVVITHFQRSSQGQKAINWMFWDATGSNTVVLHLRRSDGFESDTFGGGDMLVANKNATKTLSHNGSLIVGSIAFQTTETFSARYNRYVPDVATQVVVQELDSQGRVLSSSASAPSGDTATVDSSFFTYAQLSARTQTGITLTNNNAAAMNVTLTIYDLFGSATPTTTISVGAGQSISGTLDRFFPNLPPNDGGGSPVTDGNLDINAGQMLTTSTFRVDDGIQSSAPVFLGRATGPLPNNSPVLMLEQGTTDSAAAVDAQTHVRDPFPIITTPWFGGDGHTRILLFAQNVQLQNGEGPDAVRVLANGVLLKTEDVRAVPDFPLWSQIMVRLPDGLSSGTLSVTITLRGQTSNAGKIRIK